MRVEIQNKVITSVSLEFNTPAWNITDCFIILDYMLENEIVVLGGDVLDKNLRYVYAMWCYNPDPNLLYEENVKRSITRAYDYLTGYIQLRGTEFYIDIVVDDLSDNKWPPR